MRTISKKRKGPEILERQVNQGVISLSRRNSKRCRWVGCFLGICESKGALFPQNLKTWGNFLTTVAFQEHRTQMKFNTVIMEQAAGGPLKR